MAGQQFERGTVGWWVSICFAGLILGVMALVLAGLGIRLVELAWP